ncbi:unnamed protein product [Larinioides sclopetarius]|uniref:Cytochrome P450 n=1 Tax=Larinioides sclopetarius TaxID=280406 RepID=A0AAV2AV73_9ARAC
MPSTEILYGGGLATLLIGIISALLYWNFVKTYDFWKKRKVPFVRPTPFVGSAIDYVIKSIQETELQRYRKLGRIYGKEQVYMSDRNMCKYQASVISCVCFDDFQLLLAVPLTIDSRV